MSSNLRNLSSLYRGVEDSKGFVVSGGFQFHTKRFVGDMRLNSAKGLIAPTLNFEYKGNTFKGAIIGPSVISLILIWGILNLGEFDFGSGFAPMGA